jgi:NAD(P)-dependent dehydrogenase (short-subunit alcohol dehydrogenase family)
VAAERLDLRDRVCLVTGAGRGIGLATARELARRGARGVVLVDVLGDELDAAAAELGDRALAVAADVTDAGAMSGAVAAAREEFGALDVVVANAGIERIGTVRTQAREDFERVIEVNLLGSYRTLRPAIDPVVERRGHLLAVSSASVALASPLIVGYATSKAGVASLMRGLRAELAGTGATAGTAFFGFIDTSMVERAWEHPAARYGLTRLPPSMVRSTSPDAAARAIADGIERRRARVFLPRQLLGLFVLADALQALDDQVARRLGVPATVRLAESEADERRAVAETRSRPMPR